MAVTVRVRYPHENRAREEIEALDKIVIRMVGRVPKRTGFSVGQRTLDFDVHRSIAGTLVCRLRWAGWHAEIVLGERESPV